MNIESNVIAIIAERLVVPEEKCTPEARFVEDLEADSVELIELALQFEEEYNVKIEDAEIYKIKTVGDALALVRSKVEQTRQ